MRPLPIVLLKHKLGEPIRMEGGLADVLANLGYFVIHVEDPSQVTVRSANVGDVINDEDVALIREVASHYNGAGKLGNFAVRLESLGKRLADVLE